MIVPILAIVFGFPAAIYFAAVGLPVVAVFLYRRRARVVEIPAALLWESIGRPVEVRSFATLLTRILSLLMQVLIVSALIFALADPWPVTPVAQRTIFVLDVSATMHTREGAGDRMELARERISQMLQKAPREMDAVIVLAGRNPSLALPPTTDRGSALQALMQQQALDVDGDLLAAVRFAS